MAAMNIEETQDMYRFILDVNAHCRTTMVLIAHDMGVVMDILDWVVVLDYGKKIGDGTPEEVRSTQNIIDAYLGLAHLGAARATNFCFSYRFWSLGGCRGDVFACRLGFRADLQGVGRVQLCSGCHDFLCRAVAGGVHGAWPAVLGPLPVTIGLMVLVGMATERFVRRPLVNQNEHTLLMATIGLAFVLEGLAQLGWGRRGTQA